MSNEFNQSSHLHLHHPPSPTASQLSPSITRFPAPTIPIGLPLFSSQQPSTSRKPAPAVSPRITHTVHPFSRAKTWSCLVLCLCLCLASIHSCLDPLLSLLLSHLVYCSSVLPVFPSPVDVPRCWSEQANSGCQNSKRRGWQAPSATRFASSDVWRLLATPWLRPDSPRTWKSQLASSVSRAVIVDVGIVPG